MRTLIISCFFILFGLVATALSQTLDGSPYTPGKDPDIDQFIGSWKDSAPRNSHGSLIERDILTRGDPVKPPRKGAVLKYVNRFVYASLEPGNTTAPTTLNGEQEIFFILSGKGAVKAGKKSADLYPGVAVLMPASLSFTLSSSGSEPLAMYLINEPTPQGFRPNKDMLVKDENVLPVTSTNGHWVHIVKGLFGTADGLGTLESVITVALDPMTIAHPHSHIVGCEEVWTEISGESIAFIGKQIRMQPTGTGFLAPPNGNTPHASINTTDGPVKLFYFARYKDHEVRK
jgi:mannose-6-phosphate isomerase-like protein (cupin superfamily)